MTERKRYAIVGAGSRAGMYVTATAQTFAETAQLVGMCDQSQTRMNWYNDQLQSMGVERVPTFFADDFDQMLADNRPHTVIVTTIDAWHHEYVVRAMEQGCDVICEKPLTTTLDRLKAIYRAIERSGKSLRVTFNYRYAPAFTRFRQLVMEGDGRTSTGS